MKHAMNYRQSLQNEALFDHQHSANLHLPNSPPIGLQSLRSLNFKRNDFYWNFSGFVFELLINRRKHEHDKHRALMQSVAGYWGPYLPHLRLLRFLQVFQRCHLNHNSLQNEELFSQFRHLWNLHSDCSLVSLGPQYFLLWMKKILQKECQITQIWAEC